MEIGIKGKEKETAALVLAIQERQEESAAGWPGDINRCRIRKLECLSLAHLFHVSIDTATREHDILAAQAKQNDVELKK